MKFEQALEHVRRGKSMRLSHWQPGTVVKIKYPNEHSEMTVPYLYIESKDVRAPWKESRQESLSEEWEIVRDMKRSMTLEQYVSAIEDHCSANNDCPILKEAMDYCLIMIKNQIASRKSKA